MRPNRPFHQRLVGRLLLLGGVPAAIVLAIAFVLGFSRTEAELRGAVEGQVHEAARIAAFDVADENLQAVTACRVMADAAAAGFLGDRERSLALARSVLVTTPSFQATSFGWEPRPDDAAALSSDLPDAAMDASGRFLPYWHRDADAPDGIALEPLVGMENPEFLYYLEPKRIFEETGVPTSVITKPYDYEGVSLIEHIHPIVVDGRFMGIATVDRTLDAVRSRLLGLREDLGSESDLFLTTRGLFIAATEDARRNETGRALLQEAEVATSPYASLFRELGERDDESFVTVADDPVLGEPCFYGVSHVEPGGWMLVVRQPVSVASASVNRLMLGNLVGIVVALALAVGILLQLARPIIRRVERSADAVRRIGDGDLSIRIAPDDATDETGDLLRGVARMSDTLRSLAGGVGSARRDIESVTGEIVASSESEAENASGFGTSATEIAAAVREIAATAKELDAEVRRVDRRAAESAETTREGRRRLSDMSEAMRSVQDATRGISTRLGEISRSAGRIGGVVDTIGRIAEQTNLLSVNAAIEAEKAGEYGTGFLVVAREIRRLADQTAVATGEITETVDSMQSAVSSGVMEMDRYTDRVRRVVDETEDVSSDLGAMLETTGENAEAVGRVAEGVTAQAAGAAQIDDAMSGLSRGAEQATRTAERLKAAARRLERATAALTTALSGWRLGEGDDTV
jgi:methyl-accepting chemotaxis protein